MNIASNPWSFESTDIVSAAITALAQEASNPAVIDATIPAHGLTPFDYITIVDTNPADWVGFYRVLETPTVNTATLFSPSLASSGAILTAYVSGGTSNLNQYASRERIEDMSWQNAAAAGHLLRVVDKNGFPLWNAQAAAAGTQNRGKLFWCNGFTLVEMDSGILLVTIN